MIIVPLNFILLNIVVVIKSRVEECLCSDKVSSCMCCMT